MENKLQELTDKLYKEGLSKGKEEGEAILAKANEKAAEIIEEAKKQAESILKKAHKDAEDYKTKVEGDVKMAAVQSIQATRKDIENLMVGKMTDKQVSVNQQTGQFHVCSMQWVLYLKVITILLRKLPDHMTQTVMVS